ncbi:MAG: glycosyltransferase [Clostridia bacterium]|nr:glycosyltransferase [Clostridia bacterium]
MIITLVTDQFFQNNHGTSVSSQRIYNGLINLGHTVRVLTIDNGKNTEFAVKERYFGKLITEIINSQGFQFGKPEQVTLEKAILGSDIVHVYLPFKLGYTTIQLCKKLNVPCTASFHLSPENITSTLYLEKSKIINESLWKDFYRRTYRHVKHIHTPSLMIADQLVKHKYHANLHVISNGFNDMFRVEPNHEKPKMLEDKFIICFVGRFSREKRHDLIIKAVNASKYKDKIQLVFAGKGPILHKIMSMSKKLPNYPIFTFLSRPQLVDLYNYADLYIHPADIEIEGMSCLEAIACGCVPVVSNSKKSATSQFTVHENSVFEHGNYIDLANKIDWWIEHEEDRIKQKDVVAHHANKFTLERSMNYYLEMFDQAIEDWDKDYNGKDKRKAIETKIINPYIQD